MFEQIYTHIMNDLSGILVQLFFAYTIVLMVLDGQKPPIQTSILTGIALIVLALGGSLVSPFTAGLTVINGLLWLTLAWQRYNQNK